MESMVDFLWVGLNNKEENIHIFQKYSHFLKIFISKFISKSKCYLRLHYCNVIIPNPNHSHLLKGEDAPVCPSCKVQLTTKHILLNCNNLKHIRTKYYQARNLRDIFKNTNPENIFNFLKKSNFFSKI